MMDQEDRFHSAMNNWTWFAENASECNLTAIGVIYLMSQMSSRADLHELAKWL